MEFVNKTMFNICKHLIVFIKTNQQTIVSVNKLPIEVFLARLFAIDFNINFVTKPRLVLIN